MFKGYLEFAGVELVNQQRTEAYVQHLAPKVLQVQGGANTLHVVTGDEGYRTPVLDAAPWSNPLDPATDEFYGLYPLDVQGIGDSTYAASTTESVQDGGTTTGGRSGTRDVKLSGLLVAGTERGAEAGLTWLRAVAASGDCDDQCGGGYLRYFLAEPSVCATAWGAESGATHVESFPSLSAGKRIVYRWTDIDVDPSMPARVRWTTATTQGVRCRYGARTADGSELFAAEVTPLRINYVPNPTFRTSVTGWSGSGLVWVSAGGVDGGGFARLAVSDAAPSVFGVGTFGAGPFGSSSGPETVTSAAWASPAGTVTVSLALRGAGTQVVLSLLDASSGTVRETVTVVTGEDWTRVALTGVTTGTTLRLVTDGQLDIDQVMCEVADTAAPYFDGDSEVDGYTIGWLGSDDASGSLWQLTAPMELVADDSDFLPFLEVLSGVATNIRLTWWYRTAIDLDTQLLPIDRSLHNVAVTQGPQIIQRVDGASSGYGYIIQVELLFNAGNPYSYSPGVSVPTTPLLTGAFADPVPAAVLDDDWLFDPTALVPSAPPSAPDIVADAIDASITAWQRFYISIPKEDVADWAASVPILTLSTHDTAVRQVRVRFHPNPFGYAPQRVDPTAYCADFLVSYLPAGTSLLMNGMTQTAVATKAGVATVPAESILYGSDGGPMTWPHLSCGIGYVMTVDVPAPSDFDLFDVDLQILREE